MTGPADPPAVCTRLREITARVRGADGLLIGLDFDGTMAPIAIDPDRPVATARIRRAAGRLVARPDCSVAVISGRALADLRGRVGIDGVVYAGNHGLELDVGDRRPAVHPTASRIRPALDQLLPSLRRRLDAIPGVAIEDKGLTATVHVRRTPEAWLDEVHTVVAATVREADAPIGIETGKAVIELRPAVEWDKGSAVRWLAERMPDQWATVYIGDDVTDEDAFQAVRPPGFGVLVGYRSDTAAAYHLPAQSAVAPFLEWLDDIVLDPPPAAPR